MSFEHPSVYIATYSNTDVYECLVGDAPIMRRCKDNWVNATQILKLCDFPKAKRTKILEKGVQQGLHEKVQGGYGRFQGTWIPLEAARGLAKDYDITAETVPVLYVDVDDPSVMILRKAKVPAPAKDGTPSKRKYVRKPALKELSTPKKMKFDDHLPPQAVFKQDFPHGVSRMDAPNGIQMPPSQTNSHMGMVPMPHMAQMQREYSNGEAVQNMGYQGPSNYVPPFVPQEPGYAQLPNNAQMPYAKPNFPAGMDEMSHQQIMFQQQQNQNHGHNQSQGQNQNPGHNQIQNQGQNQNQSQGQNRVPSQNQNQIPNQNPIPNQNTQSQLNQLNQQKPALSHSTNETNWSQEEHSRDSDTSVLSSDPKMANGMDEDNLHVAQLLRFFSDDNAPIPFFLYNPPADFNINEAIDDEGHSTLHWAASIGNLNLVRLLLSKNANPLVVSNFGLNPLSKCITFNNCYDMKNFPHMVDALEACLINTDINGRTPLHYICQFSKVTSKLPALTYYVDVVFKKLTMMSRNSGTGVDLIKNVIDHQDVNGDTCLHLAARSRCTPLVKFFLSNGARDDLLDLGNQTAKSIIMQLGLVYNFGQQNTMDKRFEAPPRQLQKQLFDAQNSAGHIPQEQHHPHIQSNKINSVLPTFQISQSANETQHNGPDGSQHDESKRVINTLGTPIRGFSRLAETPDTQRTTVQDEEDDEIHDHVSKEQLKSLLERQAGTVEENKENIFVDDVSKRCYESVSTPKQGFVTQTAKSNVLGVISESAHESTAQPSLDGPHVLRPPQLDSSGRFVSGRSPFISNEEVVSKDKHEVNLQMKDVSAMVNGMMNSLSTSYEEELSGLRGEQERVKLELEEKKVADQRSSRKVKALLEKDGFKETKSLHEAEAEINAETFTHTQELKHKEAQLQSTLSKWDAYELAGLVQEQESKISISGDIDGNDSVGERWELSVQLSRAQLRRVELTHMLAEKTRDFAISAKMNKYRKLISLSCGLKVEDIDGLIDGIEESLTGASMEA